MRVLIIGAGPTGLTAAVELARRGINAHVIDRRDAASTFSRAVGIIPRSLSLLKASGVAEKLVAEGMKFKRVKFYRSDDLILDMRVEVQEVQYGHDFILGLAQDRTESILAEAARELGAEISYGIALKDLHDDGQGVTATVTTARSGEQAEDIQTQYELGVYDYVIGADGIQSTTREILGIEYPGIELPETWSIADVDADDWPNASAFTICQLPHGSIVVVVPLEPSRFRIVSNTDDALKVLPLELKTTNIRRQGEFKIQIRQVNQYSKGRVFLAGDAAHCHSPVGGRGMNLGIADSVDLARRLAEDDLESYTAVRHAAGKHVIGMSETVRKIMTSPNPLTRMLVLAVLKTVSLLPFLQRRIARQMLYG